MNAWCVVPRYLAIFAAPWHVMLWPIQIHAFTRAQNIRPRKVHAHQRPESLTLYNGFSFIVAHSTEQLIELQHDITLHTFQYASFISIFIEECWWDEIDLLEPSNAFSNQHQKNSLPWRVVHWKFQFGISHKLSDSRMNGQSFFIFRRHHFYIKCVSFRFEFGTSINSFGI